MIVISTLERDFQLASVAFSACHVFVEWPISLPKVHILHQFQIIFKVFSRSIGQVYMLIPKEKVIVRKTYGNQGNQIEEKTTNDWFRVKMQIQSK